MANVDIIESIEALKERPARTEQDGIIVAIFEESATIQIVGSSEIRANVALPQHVDSKDLTVGQHVKMGQHQGQPIILAVLDAIDEATNYSGLGFPLPVPPQIHLQATREGWLVSWAPVAGADRYHVYRNDTADEVTPDDLGYITETSLIIPYESPFIYFAVATVSGLNESELSGWVTDSLAPPVPDTFNPANAVGGHLMTVQGTDVALADPSFKCFEIQQADDASGTNAASLGNFFWEDLPSLQEFEAGVVKWYRIRSVDWAGNVSAWTAWDDAWAIAGQIKDLFDGYGGEDFSDLESLWWLLVDKFDTGWVVNGYADSVTAETTNYIEGHQGINVDMYNFDGGTGDFRGQIKKTLPSVVDYSNEGRFGNNDYILLSVYLSEITTNEYSQPVLRLSFSQADLVNYFVYEWYEGSLSVGWNHLLMKKSDFNTQGSPDWSQIKVYAFFHWAYNDGYAIYDDLRVVKADPDDATTYNDTGESWDKAADTGSDVGEWHVYPGNRTGEPNKPFSYGQIKTAASPSVWYLSHKPLLTTSITSTVQTGLYLKEDDGLAGLAFFVKDVTASSWDMYVLEADSSGNTITLAKYVGGTRTQIAQTSFTFAPDEILWLGADFKEYDKDGGRIKVYASLNEGNLIQADNLIMSEQDTTWAGQAGGSVGVLSKQANVRFVNFVAGSPAHAETADLSFSLDGPVLGYSVDDGLTKRVRYNADFDGWEWTVDGQNWTRLVADLISPFLALPGLRGYWPMSAFDSSGNAQDISGHGHHLTYNGNPIYNFDGLAPYIALDGTGDYLSRTDETDFDITGGESFVNPQGLTIGGWFHLTDGTPAAASPLIGKWNITGNQRAYLLSVQTDGTIDFLISNDGSAVTTASTTGTISDATWFFAVGRFDPSTELATFLNGTKYTNTTSIPASIVNSSADLEVGGANAGSLLTTGRGGSCFVCNMALSDEIINKLFQASRGAFGI